MIEERPVVSQTESRQASPRRLNFRVLATSLTLAVIAGLVVYNWFW
jgi:hypothetical protein